MKRLFILQVLLFFDRPELSIGVDVSEEPSHDKFVVHIPIPIPLTFKYPHSFLKITENDGKRQHSLEFYHPKTISSHSYHQKHYQDHDRKPKSKKRPQHHSRGSITGYQHGKKAKTTRDEDNEEKNHLENGQEGFKVGSRGQIILPQRYKGQGHLLSFFEQDHFRIKDKLKHDFESPSKDYSNHDSFSIDKDRHGILIHGGRADRGHKYGPESKIRDDRRSVYGQKKKSNFHGVSSTSHNHPSKSHKNSPRGKVTQQYGLRNKHTVTKQRERNNRSKHFGHTFKDNFHPDFDSLKSERPETEETNLEFHSEDASFNSLGSFPPSQTNYVEAKKRAPDLHPNWADEGLISPFALNDVLFKDKKYSKKVFKELGFYPLFLPYEVNENQEK